MKIKESVILWVVLLRQSARTCIVRVAISIHTMNFDLGSPEIDLLALDPTAQYFGLRGNNRFHSKRIWSI